MSDRTDQNSKLASTILDSFAKGFFQSAGVLVAIAVFIGCIYFMNFKTSNEERAKELARNFLIEQSKFESADGFLAYLNQVLQFGDENIDPMSNLLMSDVYEPYYLNGWTVTPASEFGEKNPNIYFVTYTYNTGDSRFGYFVEVDINNNFVRNVPTNDQLARKYELRSQERYEELEKNTFNEIEKILGFKPDYKDHVLRVNFKKGYEFVKTDADNLLDSLKPAMDGRRDTFLKIVFYDSENQGMIGEVHTKQ
ncbi:MAG: hypothetical protein MI863_06670 [Desulfobacterales bacterium]|nr:hypothetical protein [Desulfobacterales bacterium]